MVLVETLHSPSSLVSILCVVCCSRSVDRLGLICGHLFLSFLRPFPFTLDAVDFIIVNYQILGVLVQGLSSLILLLEHCGNLAINYTRVVNQDWLSSLNNNLLLFFLFLNYGLSSMHGQRVLDPSKVPIVVRTVSSYSNGRIFHVAALKHEIAWRGSCFLHHELLQHGTNLRARMSTVCIPRESIRRSCF